MLASLAIEDGIAPAQRRFAMFGIALAVLLSVLDYTVVNVAMPTIARSIHCTDSAAIWILNAYQLVTLIALLPVAALGDKIGHARICRIGLVLFVLASVLCARSHSLPELAAARALQGLGGACILGVNAALLRHIYPAAMLGRAIALNGFVIGLGVALGPTIAAAVLATSSWPFLFYINLPLGGAALWFAFTALPATPRRPKSFDYLSTLLLACAIGPLVIGGDRFAHTSSPTLSLALLGGGTVSFVLLVLRQLGRPEPLLPIDLLARGGFAAAFFTSFTAFVASNFFIIAMPFALMSVMHRGPVATGLLITPWPLALMLVAPFVGRLADRYPAELLSSIGLCITASGFLLLRFMPANPGDFDIAWRIFIAGAGFGLFQPPNNKAMLIAAPHTRTGGASGMISVARLFGQTIGGMLVALTLSLAHPAPTRTCLTFATASALLAASISVLRPRGAKLS
jgi:DHA2 family multidrug resistance protein-like MFS transporter